MTYDLSGRLLTATRGGWIVTFTYDGADRVTQTTQNGETITYVYNIPARTVTITYPGGRMITENLDLRSRLSQTNDSASPPPIVQYTYDPGNRIVQRNYRNGTTAAYSYNDCVGTQCQDWITTLQHSSGSGPIAGFDYVYDNEGNEKCQVKLQDPSHSEAYGYDAIYRLTSFAVGTGCTAEMPTTQTQYTLDPVGNWPEKVTNGVPETRTHNAVNEITTDTIDGSPTTSLSYDNNGNLIADSNFTYAYDEENRLISVTQNATSVVVGQYQYDALSRRVQKIANLSGTPTTTRYFYNDQRIIEEQNASGVTDATYVYGDYIDEVLTMDRGGQTYYYHQNALWSAEVLTNSVANAVESYAYDAYGSLTTPPSIVGNPYLFTGRELDAESSDYFYRARYYDPVKGRFLQRDPLDYIVGMNLYEYAQSNPINEVDPSGLVVPPYRTNPIELSSEGPKISTYVDNLIAGLDSGTFEVRRLSQEKLEELGKVFTRSVRERLREALKGNPSLEQKRRIEQILQKLERITLPVPMTPFEKENISPLNPFGTPFGLARPNPPETEAYISTTPPLSPLPQQRLTPLTGVPVTTNCGCLVDCSALGGPCLPQPNKECCCGCTRRSDALDFCFCMECNNIEKCRKACSDDNANFKSYRMARCVGGRCQ
jgi:RHS repeat-associated protein